MAQTPDAELVQAAVNGDPDSFTKLCQRYYAAMVAIAHSIIGDSHLAEDATQQSFVKAVHKLNQLKNKDKFAAWLAAICRSTAKDMARSTVKLNSCDDFSQIEAKSQPDQHTEIVKLAIDRLSPKNRELIYMRFYNQMTYEQISKVLRISEQAINGRLRRSKKTIAEYLTRHGFSEVRL